MKIADRYDLVAVSLVVVTGGFTTGGWVLSVARSASRPSLQPRDTFPEPIDPARICPV